MTDHSEAVQPRSDTDSAQHFVPASGGRPGRRTVLRAAGLVALAGGGTAALAACGDESAGSPPATSAPAGSATSAPSAGPSNATSDSSPRAKATKSSAAKPSGPSVAESSVPQGSGVIMNDADFVITQPSKGTYKAFSKICTHQGCPVTEITSTIDCMCHGSKFSITDGSVVNGPATQPLPEASTTVSSGQVYVEG